MPRTQARPVGAEKHIPEQRAANRGRENLRRNALTSADRDTSVKRFFTFLAWPLILGPQLIFWSGALLNQIAMAVNGARMPVLWAADNPWVPDTDHSVMTHGTHLKLICDWINLHSSILSPGDVLLSLGELITGPCFWAWIAYILYRAFRDEVSVY